ncbi:hypothetical protein K438DRAFT_1770354 [Mycena galopus ATCC 62051]|nr:hypothetical protein K438DRAFT_1770354 [Mycena galopus ATCC 62051]
MVFKQMKWADGFFPDMSAGTVSTPRPSSIPDDQQSHPLLSSTSPTVVSTPFTSHSSLPGHHQHVGSSSRPNLSLLFIPTPFTSNLRSPTTFTTPNSGYQSAFTPNSGTSFQFSPDSPLDQRGKRAYPADDLPPLYHFPEEEDDSDDEDNNDYMVVSEAQRLLKLYHAGYVVAEVGVNKCWRLQCNCCSNNEHSSSAPPADIRPPSPNIQQPLFNPAPAPATSCPGILIDWDIGAPGWIFPWHCVIHRGASESQTESFGSKSTARR